MRLWHWKLIPVLPRQQLLGQWRECCLIAKKVAEDGTPNHILVNPVVEDYYIDDFFLYCNEVVQEMHKRGYQADLDRIFGDGGYLGDVPFGGLRYDKNEMYKYWHNDQYFWQCYYNLQEKHDRGGIADDEWQKIEELADQERSKSKWK